MRKLTDLKTEEKADAAPATTPAERPITSREYLEDLKQAFVAGAAAAREAGVTLAGAIENDDEEEDDDRE